MSENTENVIKLVDDLFQEALVQKASDIHIEPMRRECLVRFRVDGLLLSQANLPLSLHQGIVARIKIMANVRTDEQRRPQDGRIDLSMSGVSLRVSTMPTLYGEKLALRVINESQVNFSLSELGLSVTHQNIIMRNLEKSYGLIAVCGPTGSGKTTTLYSLLSHYSGKSLNVSTLEDPIERAVHGVNQTQINPNAELGFASGLRALLRQDPDVLMVGEIRDLETMRMATNAALTGHVVLTTLHTNDASSAFTRFIEMKVEEFVVSSVVNLIIAQRLVRRVCMACKVEAKLDESMLAKVSARADILNVLEQAGVKVEELKYRTFLRGQGCGDCRMTGYSGRVGVYELLEMNQELQSLLYNQRSASLNLGKVGTNSLIHDAVTKVLDGTTTFSEIMRAITYK
ncbi:MAG: type II/IV secretion system protein [Candidatus Doudnabacteria bacterium]|nr:type II/IV secretion system protein [Candidatus Doudnabacteria bacterium]